MRHHMMAALRMAGCFVKGSGWTKVLDQAGVATLGTAEGFLSASNVTKTRYAHQVTPCALYHLLREAYSLYEQDDVKDSSMTFAGWHTEKLTKVPVFEYWNMLLNLELDILAFICSIREGNVKACKESIKMLLP